MVSLDSPLRGWAEQYLSLFGRYRRWRPGHIGDGGYGAARCTPRLPQCPASGDTDRGDSDVRHIKRIVLAFAAFIVLVFAVFLFNQTTQIVQSARSLNPVFGDAVSIG